MSSKVDEEASRLQEEYDLEANAPCDCGHERYQHVGDMHAGECQLGTCQCPAFHELIVPGGSCKP